jgi:uncharacterized protein YkwD
MLRQTLLLLLIVLGATAPGPLLARQPTAAHTVFLPVVIRPVGPSLSAQEQGVLDAINQIRAQRAASSGTPCPALSVSPQLQQAAQVHSDDMARRNFFSHTNPDGIGPFERVAATGYEGSRVAENIAAGYPSIEAVVQGWMESPGHRANILNCTLTETGIGYVFQGDDRNDVRTSASIQSGPFFFYWTQTFGTP